MSPTLRLLWGPTRRTSFALAPASGARRSAAASSRSRRCRHSISSSSGLPPSASATSWSSDVWNIGICDVACSAMITRAWVISADWSEKHRLPAARTVPQKRPLSARGLNCGSRGRLASISAAKISGASISTTANAFTRFPRPFIENSWGSSPCRRAVQQRAAAEKKPEWPRGHAWAAAQTTAESSCGLCWGRARSAASRSRGYRSAWGSTWSFAKDQRMLAMFCGTISWRLRMETFSIRPKSAGWRRPTVAKAQAVFESS
mmetsp:Transcript_110330/g.237478  ORF Transcript_110330/g.237478 Transcript_110330/m.237478 type:complete len:261 (-) Transcript_110330:9-791(-)